jgi:hypothetical protein
LPSVPQTGSEFCSQFTVLPAAKKVFNDFTN